MSINAPQAAFPSSSSEHTCTNMVTITSRSSCEMKRKTNQLVAMATKIVNNSKEKKNKPNFETKFLPQMIGVRFSVCCAIRRFDSRFVPIHPRNCLYLNSISLLGIRSWCVPHECENQESPIVVVTHFHNF